MKKRWYIQVLKDTSFYILLVISLVLLNKYVIINAIVPSGSMENTVMTGDIILGNRLAVEDIDRYDIAIFIYPDDSSKLYIKRVIGLPGETVEVKNGYVYANEIKLKDDFIKEEMNQSGDGIYCVPEDSYFMLGDNRNNSKDSRFWENKYVKKEAIIAKPVARIWPLTRIEIIN